MGRMDMFMLDAVEQTAIQTSAMVRGIKGLMMEYKQKIGSELPKIYSQDLTNNLFRHPYTKIDFVVTDLEVSHQTASKYLEQLVEKQLVTIHKIGKENYYVNDACFNISTMHQSYISSNKSLTCYNPHVKKIEKS
jgi:Fic family protein